MTIEVTVVTSFDSQYDMMAVGFGVTYLVEQYNFRGSAFVFTVGATFGVAERSVSRYSSTSSTVVHVYTSVTPMLSRNVGLQFSVGAFTFTNYREGRGVSADLGASGGIGLMFRL